MAYVQPISVRNAEIGLVRGEIGVWPSLFLLHALWTGVQFAISDNDELSNRTVVIFYEFCKFPFYKGRKQTVV